MQVDKMKRLRQFGLVIILPLFLLFLTVGGLARIAHAQDDQDDDFGPANLIVNGNFEDGFYPVPQLGFEPPDVGQVPIDWNWYKNSAYGKYTINNREGFGLECFTDEEFGFLDFNALAIDMQSTDQQDARLGVYQTVNVVPGQEYLFSISGTIQSMQGSPEASEDSHKVELVFDHTGGDDWEAIPNEKWTRLPWSEYELEFKTSGPEDPDIATVESYTTVVKARSDKMTIFLTAYRKWPDWRTVHYTFDCVSLIPLDQAPAWLLGLEEAEGTSGPTTADQLRTSSTIVGRPQAPVAGQQSAAPAQEADETETVPTDETSAEEPDETTPAEEPAVIPDSGAVLAEEPSEAAPAEEPDEPQDQTLDSDSDSLPTDEPSEAVPAGEEPDEPALDSDSDNLSTEEPSEAVPAEEPDEPQDQTLSSDSDSLSIEEPSEAAPAEEPEDSTSAQEPALIPTTGDALTAEAPEIAPAEKPVVIPDSGGVPARDVGKTLLLISVSVVILVGLLGAGVWNMLR